MRMPPKGLPRKRNHDELQVSMKKFDIQFLSYAFNLTIFSYSQVWHQGSLYHLTLWPKSSKDKEHGSKHEVYRCDRRNFLIISMAKCLHTVQFYSLANKI